MKDSIKALGLSLINNTEKTAEPKAIYCINNNDGSPRWIWNASARKPEFLKFYHNATLKSNLFVLICKLLFFLHLQHLFFRKFKQYVFLTDANSPLKAYWGADFFVFTGTVGPNRKYLIYAKDAAGKAVFVKQAIGKNSAALIDKEKKTIIGLSQLDFKCLVLPKLLASDACSNVMLEETLAQEKVSDFSDLHAKALNELYAHTSENLARNEFLQMHHVSKRLNSLAMAEGWRIPKGIVHKLEMLMAEIDKEAVETTFAHGDFTPWNMYKAGADKMYVYDWELSNYAYSAGFDFIHYIMQKGILIERKNWNAIKKELEQVYAQQKLSYKMPLDKQLQYYLLLNTINCLEIFAAQSNWHIQVEWLLRTWNEALSDVLKNTQSQRELVILDIFDALFKRDYAGLKLPSVHPEKLDAYSDIDLCMTFATAKYLQQSLKKHPLLAKLRFQKGWGQSNLTMVMQNQSFLSVDLIHNFKRKGLQFMELDRVLVKANANHLGIKRMELFDTIHYIGFFYGLNNAPVPSKYTGYEEILNGSSSELDLIFYAQFVADSKVTPLLYQYLNNQIYNKGLSWWRNQFEYLADAFKRFFSAKGMVITFSGVDGSGKSTIIELTKKELEKRLRRKVVVLRHRPSLLPILSAFMKGKEKAESDARDTLPRQGTNQSFLGSLLRYTYYFTDYFFGQFYIFLRYVLRGDIVLYDRYYFDFINDSERSNIRLPKWILRIGYRLLLKPQLNFLLIADSNIIRSRKQELTEETITQLTEDYRDLFSELNKKSSHRYFAIENVDLNKTMYLINKEITLKLA